MFWVDADRKHYHSMSLESCRFSGEIGVCERTLQIPPVSFVPTMFVPADSKDEGPVSSWMVLAFEQNLPKLKIGASPRATVPQGVENPLAGEFASKQRLRWYLWGIATLCTNWSYHDGRMTRRRRTRATGSRFLRR